MTGFRKPSLKKSIAARTYGKGTRQIKRALIPGYGKKGTGWLTNPSKAAYNHVYKRTTVGLSDLGKKTGRTRGAGLKGDSSSNGHKEHFDYDNVVFTGSNQQETFLEKVLIWGGAILITFSPVLFSALMMWGLVSCITSF